MTGTPNYLSLASTAGNNAKTERRGPLAMNGDARSKPPVGTSGVGNELQDTLPRDLQEGPDGERDAAREEMASSREWNQHPINIRFSIRLLLSRYYLVLLAGPERRPKSRRREEGKQHPLATLNHFWLVASLPAAFICGVLGSMLGAYIAFVAVLGR